MLPCGGVDDTHPTAEAVQIELLRQAGTTKRASLALRLSQEVVVRSRRALAERMPGASSLEVNLRWVELWYGPDLAARLRQYLSARRGARGE